MLCIWKKKHEAMMLVKGISESIFSRAYVNYVYVIMNILLLTQTQIARKTYRSELEPISFSAMEKDNRDRQKVRSPIQKYNSTKKNNISQEMIQKIREQMIYM